MPDSAAKKAWVKENTITISLRLNKNTDEDIINYLSRKENRHGTIKNAIRAYIEAEKETTKMFKYFCGCCGHYFVSDIPERDKHGIPSSIYCPECGAWDIYPDTAEGAQQSCKDQIAHENKVEQWADDLL